MNADTYLQQPEFPTKQGQGRVFHIVRAIKGFRQILKLTKTESSYW